MFCRKCGDKIPNDSIFCPECGTKVDIVIKSAQKEALIPELDTEDISPLKSSETTDIYERNNNDQIVQADAATECPKSNGGKLILISLAVVAAIVILTTIIVSIVKSGRCEYYEGCSNKKKEGSDYCRTHLCMYQDCTLSKSYNSNFCFSHRCVYNRRLCTNPKTTGSEYCLFHTCEVDDCYEYVVDDSPYCSNHQIDMRDRLGRPSMSFSLNSAGGIQFNFSATNNSGKTIKYVRFNVYLKNAVGDSIRSDITNDQYIKVEIIGPIKSGAKATLSNETIGYCEKLAQLEINDITIVYTDETSETGSYNYYCS